MKTLFFRSTLVLLVSLVFAVSNVMAAYTIQVDQTDGTVYNNYRNPAGQATIRVVMAIPYDLARSLRAALRVQQYLTGTPSEFSLSYLELENLRSIQMRFRQDLIIPAERRGRDIEEQMRRDLQNWHSNFTVISGVPMYTHLIDGFSNTINYGTFTIRIDDETRSAILIYEYPVTLYYDPFGWRSLGSSPWYNDL